MPNDYTINECIKGVMAIRRANPDTEFHQKWTCQHCHSRQTMQKPNQFFRSGRCEECGEATIIKKCNYLVIIKGEPK